MHAAFWGKGPSSGQYITDTISPLLEQGYFVQAAELLEQKVKEQPKNLDYQMALYNTYFNLTNYASALALCEQIQTLLPELVYAQMKAAIYLEEKQFDSALATYQTVADFVTRCEQDGIMIEEGLLQSIIDDIDQVCANLSEEIQGKFITDLTQLRNQFVQAKSSQCTFALL